MSMEGTLYQESNENMTMVIMVYLKMLIFGIGLKFIIHGHPTL